MRPNLPRIAAVAVAVGGALTLSLVAAPPPARADVPSYSAHVRLAPSDDLRLLEVTQTSTGAGSVEQVEPAGWRVSSTSETVPTEVTLTARIEDYGQLSDYWVQLHASVTLDVDWGIVVTGECTFYRGAPSAGGVLLDPSTEAPYGCPFGTSQWSKELGLPEDRSVALDVPLASFDWATVRGSIAPVGAVSLRGGYLESPSTRFIVDGIHYPTDPAAQAPYLSISSGAHVDWAAFRRNSEAAETASGFFSYRIYDEGVETGFWVTGAASNERGVEFWHVSTCDIFAGDPLHGGTATTTTPYRCDMSSFDFNGRGDWFVRFEVNRADVRDIGPLQAAPLLAQGCAAGEAHCFFLPTARQAVLDPMTPLTSRVWNLTGAEVTNIYKYVEKHEVTHSFDVSVSASVSILEIFKAAVKVAYGVEVADGTDVTRTQEATVPAYSAGWLSQAQSWDSYTGNFVFEVDGVWYRSVGATFRVPVSATDIVVECAAVAGIPQTEEAEKECPLNEPIAFSTRGPNDTVHGGGLGAEAPGGSEGDPTGGVETPAMIAGSQAPGGADTRAVRLAASGGESGRMIGPLAVGVLLSVLGGVLVAWRRSTART